jgi:hypothetical protein
VYPKPTTTAGVPTRPKINAIDLSQIKNQMFAKLSETAPSKPASQAEIEVPKPDESVHNTP